MDQDLRDLERTARAAPGDLGARVRLVAALLRLERWGEAWDAIGAGLAARGPDPLLERLRVQLFTAARAPFTLIDHSAPDAPRATEGPLRFLGAPNGARVVILLGRAVDCGVRLQAPTVGRRHARLEYEGGLRFAIQDLGSSNRTYVGDVLVSRAPLADGARFRLGPVELELRLGWHGVPWPAPVSDEDRAALLRLGSEDAPPDPGPAIC